MDSVETGRFLSMLLRHRPESIGLKPDRYGYADIKELLSKMPAKFELTMDGLEYIVENNNKQRYSFNEDHTKIRANQGHSIPVDAELNEADPPEFLYHGTAEQYLNRISAQGLKKMRRLHVHLSRDRATAVKVGSRHGKPIVLRVRAGEMSQEGYTFYLSVNHVWLTDHVPVKYLELPDETEE